MCALFRGKRGLSGTGELRQYDLRAISFRLPEYGYFRREADKAVLSGIRGEVLRQKCHKRHIRVPVGDASVQNVCGGRDRRLSKCEPLRSQSVSASGADVRLFSETCRSAPSIACAFHGGQRQMECDRVQLFAVHRLPSRERGSPENNGNEREYLAG